MVDHLNTDVAKIYRKMPVQPSDIPAWTKEDWHKHEIWEAIADLESALDRLKNLFGNA